MNMNLLQEKTDSDVKATAGVWSWSINPLQDKYFKGVNHCVNA